MRRTRSAALTSRNFEMSGRRTSARLESPLWRAFDEICSEIGVNRAMLARMIDARRARGTGLTSALRIFLLSYYRSAARKETRSRTEDGLLHLIAALDTVGPTRDEAAPAKRGRDSSGTRGGLGIVDGPLAQVAMPYGAD